MGQLLSNRQPSRPRYRRRKEDLPYVTAISNIDWKRHLNIANRQELDAAIMERNMIHTNLPAAISDSIYISDAMGVCRLTELKELGITHVLNVAGCTASRLPIEAYEKAGIEYKAIEALDEATYPMLERHWQEAREFLEKVRRDENGKCVVHCMAGMNRSGVIVAADYMLSRGENVLETVLHCRKCRGNLFLSSNFGFQQQLVAMARVEGLLGPAPGEPGCVVKKPA